MTDNRDFDIVIFGATGYTGMYVIEELAKSTINANIKWAVAGRNIDKLRSSLQQVQEYLTDIDILQTPLIKADIYDQKSIVDMCKKAKVILNCVGPYKLYGEPVVLACIEVGTHHVDLSGEFEYLELSQARHFKTAREKGVYIVQACGFDSIPGDYGISLMKKNFPGDLNSVEYYVEALQGPLGRKTNIGTYLSAVGSMTDFFNISDYDKAVKQEVFKKDLPENKYKLSWRLPPLFFSDVIKGWCLWFLGPDERVIKRSQMFRYTFLNERPIESHGYAKVSLLGAFYIMLFGLINGFFSFFSCGRALLAKYPGFFTCGQFSKDGPTREQVEGCSTQITFIGEGWKYKLSEPTDQHVAAPDTKMKLTLTGPEAAYPLTAMCMVHAGLVVLQERDKMPLEGGVLTPGIAFEHTTLSERLEKRGMKFTFERL